MRRARALLLPAALAVVATPAAAVPGGALGTLETGRWYCEVPGDAATPAVARPAESFTAIKDSSYRTDDGQRGSYLVLGDVLVMTTGPFRGNRYHRDSVATLRQLDAAGAPVALRCVRAGDPAANPVAIAAPLRPAR